MSKPHKKGTIGYYRDRARTWRKQYNESQRHCELLFKAHSREMERADIAEEKIRQVKKARNEFAEVGGEFGDIAAAWVVETLDECLEDPVKEQEDE